MSEREWPIVVSHKLDEPKRRFRITCGKCGDAAFLNAAPGMVSDHPNITKRFQAAGWVTGRGPGHDCCPNCKIKEGKSGMAKTKTPTEPASPLVNRPLPSPQASGSIAVVYMILDEAYDKEKRTYKRGWDDDRVAKEAGVSIELVSKRRGDDFGPAYNSTKAIDDILSTASDIIEGMGKIHNELVRAASEIEDKRLLLQDIIINVNMLRSKGDA